MRQRLTMSVAILTRTSILRASAMCGSKVDRYNKCTDRTWVDTLRGRFDGAPGLSYRTRSYGKKKSSWLPLSPTVPLTLPVQYVASRVPGQVMSFVGPSIGPTPVLHTAGALIKSSSTY